MGEYEELEGRGLGECGRVYWVGGGEGVVCIGGWGEAGCGEGEGELGE